MATRTVRLDGVAAPIRRPRPDLVDINAGGAARPGACYDLMFQGG
jgi:hypothetical protein